VVYRLGWAPTRAAARQLVAHNHVQINNKRMNIPSYLVEINDLVTLKKKATNIPAIAEVMNNETYATPEWLKRKHNIGKVTRFPERDEIKESIEEQLILEYYSR